VSQWLAEKASGLLGARTTRRSFIVRAAVTGSALSVAPLDYVLRPGTAYAAICGCAGQSCDCGSLCCDGYTQFCCTINGGANSCPPGTTPGGWWKADGSIYCNGPRYYIDCNALCGCSSGCGTFCDPSCDGLNCECALGDCNNRRVGCNQFRYGQCHQEIGCMGRISCRVVSCTPPWLIDGTCSTTSATDDNTANHTAPCLQAPSSASLYGFAAYPPGGYYFVGNDGGVFANGGAPFFGSMGGQILNAPMVGIAVRPTNQGYWLVASDGGIFTFGDAPFLGSMGGIRLNQPVVGMASTPSGNGYWMVAADGGIFTFGDAPFFGSTGSIRLNQPVVGMAATPGGGGYWLVARDGGIFTFGDAPFLGSLGSLVLDSPIVGMFPTPTGRGYYLLGGDGGVFTFGDAPYLGSYPGLPSFDRLVAPGEVRDFFGMSLRTSGSGVNGYTLYGVQEPSPPPPAVNTYSFP
jgi:hypothetical protein